MYLGNEQRWEFALNALSPLRSIILEHRKACSDSADSLKKMTLMPQVQGIDTLNNQLNLKLASVQNLLINKEEKPFGYDFPSDRKLLLTENNSLPKCSV